MMSCNDEEFISASHPNTCFFRSLPNRMLYAPHPICISSTISSSMTNACTQGLQLDTKTRIFTRWDVRIGYVTMVSSLS